MAYDYVYIYGKEYWDTETIEVNKTVLSFQRNYNHSCTSFGFQLQLSILRIHIYIQLKGPAVGIGLNNTSICIEKSNTQYISWIWLASVCGEPTF